MKTTLSIDDTVLRDLKQIAEETKTSLKEVVDRALRAGIDNHRRGPQRRPFPRPSFALGGRGRDSVGFDRALMLAFDDEAPVRKLAPRK